MLQRVEEAARLELQRVEEEAAHALELQRVEEEAAHARRVEEAARLEFQRVEEAARALELQRVEEAARALELQRNEEAARALELQRVEEAARLELQRVEEAARLELQHVEEAARVDDIFEIEVASFCNSMSHVHSTHGDFTFRRSLRFMEMKRLDGLLQSDGANKKDVIFTVNGIASDTIRIYVQQLKHTMTLQHRVAVVSGESAWKSLYPGDLTAFVTKEDAYTIMAWCTVIMSTPPQEFRSGTFLRCAIDTIQAARCLPMKKRPAQSDAKKTSKKL